VSIFALEQKCSKSLVFPPVTAQIIFRPLQVTFSDMRGSVKGCRRARDDCILLYKSIVWRPPKDIGCPGNEDMGLGS